MLGQTDLLLLAQNGRVSLTRLQADQLVSLAVALEDWGQRMNLTAVRGLDAIATYHVLDSLTVLPVLETALDSDHPSLIDVGAGAGFPGLVLAIARPDVQVVLVEATQKKVRFMEHVVASLGLGNAHPMAGRAEDVARAPEWREHFDVATARAVAGVATLVEWLAPLVRVSGRLALMKSQAQAGPEVARAGRALRELGCRIEGVCDVSIPGMLEARSVVVVEKVAPTPAQYPRRVGLAARRPLGG